MADENAPQSPPWTPAFAPPPGPLEGPSTTDAMRVGLQSPPNGPKVGSYVHVKYDGVCYGARVVLVDYLTGAHRVIFDADEGHAFADIKLCGSALWAAATDPHPPLPAALMTRPTEAARTPAFMVGRMVVFDTHPAPSAMQRMQAVGLIEAHLPHKASRCIHGCTACRMDVSTTRYSVKFVLKCVSRVVDLGPGNFTILA